MKLTIENINNVNTKITLDTECNYDLQERANVYNPEFCIDTKDILDAIKDKKDIEYIDIFNNDSKIIWKFHYSSNHNIRLHLIVLFKNTQKCNKCDNNIKLNEYIHLKTDISTYYLKTEFIEEGKTVIDIEDYELF